MTYVTASNAANHLPLEMAVTIGTILEREYRQEFPNASVLNCTRDVRKAMRALDLETAAEILQAEGR